MKQYLAKINNWWAKNRRLLLAVAVLIGAHYYYCAYAQTGAAGFEKATTEIKSYEIPVKNLMRAIAAVIAIVGAFNVYFKMQNGDQDVKKTIMLTLGGCVAFVALAEALPMFFK